MGRGRQPFAKLGGRAAMVATRAAVIFAMLSERPSAGTIFQFQSYSPMVSVTQSLHSYGVLLYLKSERPITSPAQSATGTLLFLAHLP